MVLNKTKLDYFNCELAWIDHETRYTNQCICQLKPRVGEFVYRNAGTDHYIVTPNIF